MSRTIVTRFTCDYCKEVHEVTQEEPDLQLIPELWIVTDHGNFQMDYCSMMCADKDEKRRTNVRDFS